jgi:cell wall assembly regulator SMI1
MWGSIGRAAQLETVRQRSVGVAAMDAIEDLFDEIEKDHSFEPCTDPTEIDSLETTLGYTLPRDLKSFYRKYNSVSLFVDPIGGPAYRFVPPSEIHPTRIDIYGQDTDEWGPSTWLTVCDVLDGNYVALDIASGSGDQYNYIDCFHETFAEPGQSTIVARSLAELVRSALDGGGDRLFWGHEGFVPYGDAMPLTAPNAAIRVDNPEAREMGWLVRFTHLGKSHRHFFADRQYGGKEMSLQAVERYIEETTK